MDGSAYIDGNNERVLYMVELVNLILFMNKQDVDF